MKYLKRYETYTLPAVNEGVLLAPNGRPSNLPSKYYPIVRSPEFKSWFGDWENDPENSSQAVDENGEPLLCYHGSKIKFSVFDTDYQKTGWLGKGFYFTDDKAATKEYGRATHEVFLNIRNPFRVKGEDPSSVITEIQASYRSSLEDMEDDVSIPLKEHQHDGVFFTHWDKGNMYTCFYPTQIKMVKDFK